MKPIAITLSAVLVLLALGYLIHSWKSNAAPALMPGDRIQGTMPSGATNVSSIRDENSRLELQGATIPNLLKTDVNGHLQKTRGVRDFFDFLLVSENNFSPAEMDNLVREQAGRQIGSPALEECLDLWRRYRLYRRDYAQDTFSPAMRNDGESAIQMLKHRLELRDTLARQHLPDVRQAWFASDDASDQELLERLLIAASNTLSPQEKQQKLSMLQPKPTDVELTPQPKERIQETEQRERRWQASYGEYAQRKARITQDSKLSDSERAIQIKQLRESFFQTPSERGRAWMFDQIDAEEQHVRKAGAPHL